MSVPTAVVTGAGSGIGAGIARAAARRGMRVIVADVRDEAAAAIAKELSEHTHAVAVTVDVRDRAHLQRLADIAYGDDGEVLLLANNAGIGRTTLLWEDPDGWRQTLEVNLLGAYNGISVFVPLMLARGSAAVIVDVGSLAGFLTSPHQSGYQVSKTALLALGESLQADLATISAPIRVLTALPGAVATRIFDDAPVPEDGKSQRLLTGMGQALSQFGLDPDAVGESIVASALETDATFMTTDANLANGFIRERITALEAILGQFDSAGTS